MAGFDQCTMSRGIVVFDINLEPCLRFGEVFSIVLL